MRNTAASSKWLACRAAAEQLKRLCMLYRFGLRPFDGADADRMLDAEIDRISAIADQGRLASGSNRPRLRDLRYLVSTPKHLREIPVSTPDQGLAQRFFYAGQPDTESVSAVPGAEQAVVKGRLAAITVGRQLWVVGAVTAFNLALIAYRDFFDYLPLSMNYIQAAGRLKEYEDAYRACKTPFDQPDATQRLKCLAESVEEILLSEFRQWCALHRSPAPPELSPSARSPATDSNPQTNANRMLLDEVNATGLWRSATKTGDVWAKLLDEASTVSTLEGPVEAVINRGCGAGPENSQAWFSDADHGESRGAYFVYVHRGGKP
jgi:hypothetical protein